MIEDATDGMVDDVTDKSDDGIIEEGNVTVDGAILDNVDRMVKEGDGVADDGPKIPKSPNSKIPVIDWVTEGSTDWIGVEDTVKED